ncbi:tail fiber assembly protein [Methylobacterium soli]|uniref:Tail fiber assembly protein n=1 Tax=Methylobacterium soli TaxID=553447 RepID=A0A6L3T4Y3_9HYPH|nr:tail fiber assembly protein [Methylobacterium soli]KAB1078375.1 tail fiber assembly protein [Methylobacterium soli]GJE45878.1 hypothetical protein AEGHOMDF_5078 [Methylobacterium soli]
MNITYTDKLDGITQASGDATLTFKTIEPCELQIDAVSTGTTGTLSVLFVTPGLSTPKAFVDERGLPVIINLARPYPAILSNLMVQSLVLRPEGLAADQTVSVSVVRTIGDGAIQLLNAKLLEATVEINALEDLIALGAGSADQASHLTEWRTYRLLICRLFKAGVSDATVWPPKPALKRV